MSATKTGRETAIVKAWRWRPSTSALGRPPKCNKKFSHYIQIYVKLTSSQVMPAGGWPWRRETNGRRFLDVRVSSSKHNNLEASFETTTASAFGVTRGHWLEEGLVCSLN